MYKNEVQVGRVYEIIYRECSKIGSCSTFKAKGIRLFDMDRNKPFWFIFEDEQNYRYGYGDDFGSFIVDIEELHIPNAQEIKELIARGTYLSSFYYLRSRWAEKDRVLLSKLYKNIKYKDPYRRLEALVSEFEKRTGSKERFIYVAIWMHTYTKTKKLSLNYLFSVSTLDDFALNFLKKDLK